MSETTIERMIDLLENETPYDPSGWLSEQCAAKGIQTNERTVVFEKKKKFAEICSIVKEELRDVVNHGEKDGKNVWLERQHDAIIGKPNAMVYFINKIEEVLRSKNITSIDYPGYYYSLSEAIFHEVWGKSILTKWDNVYPDSEACIICGTELWIDVDGKFIRQKERFDDDEKVKKIINAFKMRDSNAVLNHQNPELETEKEDGSRITMVIKPRAKEIYIVFRRFIVNNFSLHEQARRNTIPKEDVELYRALAQTMCNTIVAGRVRSAKSTFMKTLIAERDPGLTIACLEKHFELALKRHMPDRLIYELQASEGDLHKAIPRLLRMEHDYIIIGEIRSMELEAAMIACERGERGMMSTYHLTDVEHIVPQLARHSLDEFPNRIPAMEEARIAHNLDLIITMGTDRDRKVKRVTGVTEVIWDFETRTYKTVPLIRYNKKEKKYYYSSNISKRLINLMGYENEEATEKLLALLKEREQKAPMRILVERGIVNDFS